ncbi:MAG: Dot/Icm secretion system protein IcmQ [Gammaproteobacteria bacterium RIFCSPHIGHO2_12_FULL_45_9]|nr:MAG: Dot/Icm secretion system protein IcmQ [Gammaproteobacteria bacterium RIFCSPHIGHO2_12_FULL_45_9]
MTDMPQASMPTSQDLFRAELLKIALAEQEALRTWQAEQGGAPRTDEERMYMLERVIQAIDRVLAVGDDWRTSLFLRNLIQPLMKVRDEAEATKNEIAHAAIVQEEDILLPHDAELFFMSLYQVDGYNLPQWEAQLNSIEQYMAGRPIYAAEDAVRKGIRQKVSQVSEAYILVAVPSAYVLPPLPVPKVDRWGSELVSLAGGAVTPAVILEFVHLGKRYRFKEGKLSQPRDDLFGG